MPDLTFLADPYAFILPVLALFAVGYNVINERLCGPLVKAAADSLLRDLKEAHPDMSEAERIAAIRRAPDLPEQAIAALLRHHPTLPAFSGSWKFRYGLRRTLALRQSLPRIGAPSPRLTLAQAIILLTIGLPTAWIAGRPAIDLIRQALAIGLDATGSRSADVSISLILGAVAGVIALAGAACAGLGVWQLRRYLRLR
ncbi:hypothetical protein [Paramagnetospirillum magneticum]|uniref:Uncharacterized protein n=1 Tax=Paramagnetospirillum magneticum (strain ATCC 700264 / AMB-1) TaxID=342108 RepID=Q2W5H5_PARM1|nr:hypothetical protein [Paramagnetospirillum magneticum]BAE50900.1 hypothetical protein amb2096 [Paramagnetospirillum magneticum AMB-1]